MKNDIASLHANQPLTAMETNAEHSLDTTNNHQSHYNLPAIIANLKHNITTIALETRAMFQQHSNLRPNNIPKHSSVTGLPNPNQCGSSELIQI